MKNRNRSIRSALMCMASAVAVASAGLEVLASPVVSRLTPPSNLFTFGQADPVVARFLPGQRFDLQATVSPDAGQTISSVQFFIDNVLVGGTVTLTNANVAGLPANTQVATRRAHSTTAVGVHTLRVQATQSDNQVVSATGNFEIAKITQLGQHVKNVIVLIGDGMGIAHRTAARIMAKGVSQGKINSRLAMDMMPFTGIVVTHSLNSIVTDSAPGAVCYSGGNKGNNNQLAVFPDDTTDDFDNPRFEIMPEFLHRTQGKSLGIVTTADVFDATPAAFGAHTAKRADGTGICDQYLDDANFTGLTVLMGGGRKWFLPNTMPGSGRTAGTDYQLPAELSSAWGIAPGAVDPGRDLLSDYQAAGFTYVANNTQLSAIPGNTDKLLGLFALSNMNIALDKTDGRRGHSTIVNDYGFPDQPMLDEMTSKALQVLSRNPNGFCAMIEGASIDKQAHNMDTERWILDTIEFDRAVNVCLQFAAANPDTLVVVTADHECAGINIIGSSTLTDATLEARINNGNPNRASQLRDGVVGVYDAAAFPHYTIAADGYPVTTDIDYRMMIGYAANCDRYEDWRTNAQPLQDSQQPFVGQPPLNTYPAGPLNRDPNGYLVS
ncbi:MAG TPA: alkaline phosphatase, partial [Phycisphaerae bacterium]|nr:alkaline phosphatase [Phycisphaerae bacterium]